jgi:hypothetical protein
MKRMSSKQRSSYQQEISRRLRRNVLLFSTTISPVNKNWLNVTKLVKSSSNPVSVSFRFILEMIDTLKECESINGENAELTNKIKEEIEKMEKTLSEYS